MDNQPTHFEEDFLGTKRPDLNQTDPAIRAYIEALEAEIERLHQGEEKHKKIKMDLIPLGPNEPPTTVNVITATASGIAKRTPRHLYSLQHRGGMGVFDLKTSDKEPITILTIADESQNLILITNYARAFRFAVSAIKETPVHSKGESILTKLNLAPDEHISLILPILARGYLASVSKSGMVRLLRHHVFGEYMKPGTALYDHNRFGNLAAASWTPGDGDIFIATRKGRAIRFKERLVPPSGGKAIRLGEDDTAVAITGVYGDGGVFLLGANGKGIIRLMQGFKPNKAPGGGGKIAMATDHLVSAININEAKDIFIISRLSKVIRFQVSEVPPKVGVVQGINCMTFRGDEAVTAVISP